MKIETLIIVLVVTLLHSCVDQDKSLWETCHSEGTTRAYKRYLKECSECKYSDSAKLKVEVLEKDKLENLVSQEKEKWEKAKNALNIGMIENYISSCERCDYRADANNYVNDLNLWSRTQTTNTINAYQSYLQNTKLNLKNIEANRIIKKFEQEILEQERREKEKIRLEEEKRKNEELKKKKVETARINRYRTEANNLDKVIRDQIGKILQCNANSGKGSVITGVDSPTYFELYGSQVHFEGTYSAKNILGYTGDYQGVYDLDQLKYTSVKFELHSGILSGPVKSHCLSDF